MKRIYALAVFLVVFLSAALPAGGSAEKDEALYPICEDGLWGYMNRGGETVITPGWRMAYPFRNGLAQVKLTEDGRTKALIDRKGEYVSGPGELFYDEYDHAVRVAAYDGGGEGYIDRDSGFYLPPDPDIGMVILWDDDGTGPIAAQNRNGLTGYLDRASGEPVIPFRFTGEADDISFHDGFALAADEIRIEDAAGHVMALGTHRILIDPDGREITFANGITPISAVYDGIFVFSAKVPAPRGVPDGVSEEEEEEEEEYNPEDDSRDGSLALGNGERIVFPLYSLNRLTGERVELPDGEGSRKPTVRSCTGRTPHSGKSGNRTGTACCASFLRKGCSAIWTKAAVSLSNPNTGLIQEVRSRVIRSSTVMPSSMISGTDGRIQSAGSFWTRPETRCFLLRMSWRMGVSCGWMTWSWKAACSGTVWMICTA